MGNINARTIIDSMASHAQHSATAAAQYLHHRAASLETTRHFRALGNTRKSQAIASLRALSANKQTLAHLKHLPRGSHKHVRRSTPVHPGNREALPNSSQQ